MSHSNNKFDTSQNMPAQIGLIGIGTCGNWEVQIDETVAGLQKWYFQIEGPTVSFNIEIPSLTSLPSIAAELSKPKQDPPVITAHILEQHTSSIPLGTLGGLPVLLLRDDEYSDRCTLLIDGNRGGTVRILIAGDDLQQFVSALSEAIDDLEDGTVEVDS